MNAFIPIVMTTALLHLQRLTPRNLHSLNESCVMQYSIELLPSFSYFVAFVDIFNYCAAI